MSKSQASTPQIEGKSSQERLEPSTSTKAKKQGKGLESLPEETDEEIDEEPPAQSLGRVETEKPPEGKAQNKAQSLFTAPPASTDRSQAKIREKESLAKILGIKIFTLFDQGYKSLEIME